MIAQADCEAREVVDDPAQTFRDCSKTTGAVACSVTPSNMNACFPSCLSDSSYLLHLFARAGDYLFPFLGHLVWPAIVLFFGWYFRNAIGALINRAFSMKAFGVELLAGSTGDLLAARAFEEDVGPFTPPGSWSHQIEASKAQFQFDPQKAGNIYFFSHDLMLCYCALITMADSGMINHTLTCAVDHVQRFGLKDTIIHKALAKMHDNALSTKEADWTPQRRRQEARKLWLIARTVGNLLEQAYPTRG
jgi:hypothetical protein